MRVIDFFCGGGGFSEGFRQAGFDVIWSVDNWQIAVNTHKENHPDSISICDDVIRIAGLSDEEFENLVPDSEVIIGSPPCTSFSNSNNSGNADKAIGIKLIEAYLRIIARKKNKEGSILKYWILENVPKAEPHIKKEYSAKDLGLDGDFILRPKEGNSGVFNAKNFGVPSSRIRYFCGDFPMPKQIARDDSSLIPLKTILTALGNPKEKLHRKITDPIYELQLKGEDVSDHHYVQLLSDFETTKLRRLKQDKGYMGKMSVPENPEKPARTIMATMSFTSRECFVLGHTNGKLRAPTIREVATLMSFPIDYRFYGNSLGTKYRLVGNAVPPKMSFAFAKAMMKESNKNFRTKKYTPIQHGHETEFINLNLNEIPIKKEKRKKATARFKYHIPFFKFETYRVELTNYHSDFDKLNFIWNAEIHYNQGKDKAKIYIPQLTNFEFNRPDLQKANKFINQIKNKILSHNELQDVHCLTIKEIKKNDLVGPYELLDILRKFLNKEFNFQKDKKDQVLLSEPPNQLPRPIAIGYFILTCCINLMTISNGKNPKNKRA
ncbi:MAG: DNA cytosine methyltransferase [Bacteroidia bacterium]